jgi:hypothetical protein
VKTRRVTPSALFALLLLGGASQAAILEDFQFNDLNGTALSAAANSASSHKWVHDTDHPATIQVLNNSLNIIKNDTNFVTEGLEIDDVNSGVLWMVAEFLNWAIVGNAPDGNNVEELRFGFMGTNDLVPPPSSTVLAEMMIARRLSGGVNPGQFEISGTALGANGTNILSVAINFVQNDPFAMAMKVDQDADTYSIFYKAGAGPYTLLGTGNLEPTRDALIVRMAINNFIGDAAGEFINLDRFYVADAPPPGIPEPVAVPEPGTMLLIALALAGLAARRLRRG